MNKKAGLFEDWNEKVRDLDRIEELEIENKELCDRIEELEVENNKLRKHIQGFLDTSLSLVVKNLELEEEINDTRR